MAGQLGTASHRVGPRSVYVCLPDTTTADQHDRIHAVLEGTIRPSDRLLYPPAPNTADPVVNFATQHGNHADPIANEPLAPDLIVIVIDPLGDNESALQARALAARGHSDIFIAEIPEPARSVGPHDRITIRLPAEQTRKST